MSGAGWEPRFVRHARASGTIVVTVRCATAGELASALPRIDAVVVGADVAWMTRHAVNFWQRSGASVIGIAANGPESAILSRAGCDAVFGTEVAPADLLTVPRVRPREPAGVPVSVGGPRGAPGCTEIALALSWAAAEFGSVLLIEADASAPSLGLRLGLPPSRGLEPTAVGPIEAVTMPAKPGPLSRSIHERLFVAAADRYRLVVVDDGPRWESGRRLMVVVPTPVGLVRAATLLAGWTGDPPLLVANRIGGEGDLRRVRAATGLEPVALVPPCRPLATEPAPEAVDALRPLAEKLVGQRRAAE